MADLSSVPIDIHANKLLDWLISRHHCTKDWPTEIMTVRQKINAAIKDMPENETIAKILVEASPINYYHCTKIVELLKTTEADTKNIFGMYGSQRMKDWQEILKLYQRNNLYLAESASILGRNVIYEIPALKRFVSKSEQNQAECMKKEASCKKQAQDYRDKFAQRCAQLGINLEKYNAKNKDSKVPGVNYIGNQLLNQMNTELPKIFDKISEKSKNISEAVKFYRQFLKATIELSGLEEDKCLGLLHTVIEKGNVTSYEWKHGEPPLKVERPENRFSFPEENESTQEQETDAIDFGDTLDLNTGDVELETGGIDWGDLGTADALDAGAIDFSMDVLDTSGIVLEEGGCEGGVARHEEALTILESADTRGQFIDEIIELEGFLSQRLDETKHQKDNEMSLSYDADDSLRIDNLDKLLHQTTQLYAMFNETKTKELLLVHESERYVTRLAESLLQNLKLAAKLEFTGEQCSLKFAEIADEIKQCGPKTQQLTKLCKELQAQLSKEISVKYNNRPVYITGGV